MPFVGTGHIWLLGILLVVVLIIWGPGKLPDVGSGMGRAIREFRKASTETKEQFSATKPVDVARSGASDPTSTPTVSSAVNGSTVSPAAGAGGAVAATDPTDPAGQPATASSSHLANP